VKVSVHTFEALRQPSPGDQQPAGGRIESRAGTEEKFVLGGASGCGIRKPRDGGLRCRRVRAEDATAGEVNRTDGELDKAVVPYTGQGLESRTPKAFSCADLSKQRDAPARARSESHANREGPP
jgi:hypothetical protein